MWLFARVHRVNIARAENVQTRKVQAFQIIFCFAKQACECRCALFSAISAGAAEVAQHNVGRLAPQFRRQCGGNAANDALIFCRAQRAGVGANAVQAGVKATQIQRAEILKITVNGLREFGVCAVKRSAYDGGDVFDIFARKAGAQHFAANHAAGAQNQNPHLFLFLCLQWWKGRCSAREQIDCCGVGRQCADGAGAAKRSGGKERATLHFQYQGIWVYMSIAGKNYW